MEFPFNHGHHNSNVTHHHHRRDDDEETPNYPPPGNPSFNNNPHQPPPPYPPFYGVDQSPPPQPPFYGVNQPQPPFYGVNQPPPPQPPHEAETEVFHTSHVPHGHVSQNFNYSDPPVPPPPHHDQPDHSFNYGYPSAAAPAYTPPPPPHNASVHHVSHETHLPHQTHHSSPVTVVRHVGHQSGSVALSNKPTVRVVTKAAPNYSLTVRHGKVILAPSDPRDEYQHWVKDEKYSTRVKDAEGCPSFSLVNQVTGEAIKHSVGASHPVRLIPYNPDFLDESILWTESRDLGDGHRTIRMVNNIHLNVDAYHGDKNSGGVHDGTTIVLWDWNKGDNQRWKILPYFDGTVMALKTALSLS